MTKDTNFDVIIVGGSYAGLSAAMALGRSLRKVLIIDAGNPCNKKTPHSQNFITQDGEAPLSISNKAKKQVLKYPTVQYLKETAKKGIKTKHGFEIITEFGKTFQARKLIFATGIKDIMPKIKGFAECWGTTVIHCPYCHGYEVRNVKTGILKNSDDAFETGKLISNWTDELFIYTNGKSKLTEKQAMELNQKNINIVEKTIGHIEHDSGYIKGLRFNDGTFTSLKAIYSSVPFKQHSNIPKELGCKMNEQGYISVDFFQKCSVSGVFACGDNTTFMRSIAQAVYAGNVAGVNANKEMIEEDWDKI